ncbi:hypothetical protein [Streptomyces sp. NPDC002564]|uniref:hypothetical protein n=1 Tax=Streptomyces sp. NPDC002564 TaxID=3364649 RepID=UPI003696232D
MRRQHGLASTAPGAADDGASEDSALLALKEEIAGLQFLVLDVLPEDAGQGGVSRDGSRLPFSAAFEIALFVDLSGVRPLLADFRSRGVDQDFAPLITALGSHFGASL